MLINRKRQKVAFCLFLLTLLRPAFFGSLKPLKMGVMGGRFQKWVGTSYLTKIDARHEDLQLSDT